MNKEEAKKILTKARKTYQPIEGFPDSTRRPIAPFYRRIKSIADYCGHNDSYVLGGSANGYSCFELAKLGAQVIGVEGNRTNIQISEATAVYFDYPPTNPRFILGNFPRWVYETTEKSDWMIMLMLLHNILKNTTLKETCRMIDKIPEIASKGFIVSSRWIQWCRDGVHMEYKDVPDYIVANTNYNRWEFVPCPMKGNNNPDIAFGLPIWAFYE